MKILSTFFICAVAFLFMWNFIPTAEECQIYDSTLRLHVIANSDSEEDQRVKLEVRDKLLERVEGYDARSKEETVLRIMEDKEELENMAADVLKENGMPEDVSIEIGKEQYPARYYEGFALPAGSYLSVKVNIGEAKGQNWWCVLFPPMCTSFAVEADDEYYVSAGLSKEQYDMITGSDGEYKVKFKLLEIAADAMGIDY